MNDRALVAAKCASSLVFLKYYSLKNEFLVILQFPQFLMILRLDFPDSKYETVVLSCRFYVLFARVSACKNSLYVQSLILLENFLLYIDIYSARSRRDPE